MQYGTEWKIGEIKDFKGLVRYLRDDLDWPLDLDEIEDLTFEYEADELGLKSELAVKVKEIKQLRPVVDRQPWGIFWVEFENRALPVTVMRQILRALVYKKRATAKTADRKAWHLKDLMFMSSLGEKGNRRINFSYFRETGEGEPTLQTFFWDEQETQFYWLDRNHLERLRWPADTTDIESWRQQWASAFTAGYREPVRTAKDLSERLAALAANTRDAVLDVLRYESSEGPLHRLLESFQTVLLHDLDEGGFADMIAQTIAYGLFSARCTGQEVLGLAHLEAMVPNTNRFLKELFAELASISGDKKGQINFDDLGLSAMVVLLRDKNIEAVLEEFGRQAGGGKEDPVIHFYETFLNVYDKQQKVQRGVFYTPKPVVSFIVRSVHEILQKDLGLADGLADITTWGQMAARIPGLAIPKDAKAGDPFVQILDPATGTGTFLEEVIDVVHATMTTKWAKEGRSFSAIKQAWNEFVPKHLLPRLRGFELMMAPYAVAHMKIGLKLRQTGYEFRSPERLRVYLTNTLEPPEKGTRKLSFLPDFLSQESMQADQVKEHKAITVIIGNPPYSKMSANVTEPAIALIEPFRYVDGVRITDKGALALELNLQDDYVKFFGVMMQYAKKTPVFVGSYISNFRYLDSPSLRGLRAYLTQHFSQIEILNLGGHLANAAEVAGLDDNVFDIGQGVAIAAIQKAVGPVSTGVRYGRVFGDRQSKYNSLAANTLRSASTIPLSPGPLLYRFTDQVSSLENVFQTLPALDDIFPDNSGSIITSRDNLVLDHDPDTLLKKIRLFARSPRGDTALQEEIGFSVKQKWDVEACKRSLNSVGISRRFVRPILYRPFDERLIYYYPPLIDTPSRPVCEMIAAGSNLVLLTPKIKTTAVFNHALVARIPAEKKSCSHDRATQMFPLLRGNGRTKVDSTSEVNIDPEYLKRFVAEFGGDISAPLALAQSVFHYVYAILHSPTYRLAFGSLLKDGFPRIPFVNNRPTFQALVASRADLVALHLLDDDYAAASWRTGKSHQKAPLSFGLPGLIKKNNPVVVESGYPRYEQSTVWVGPNQGFTEVSEGAWSFLIGGYQVLDKWLKDRRGTQLDDADILTYRRIVKAIDETIREMGQIDSALKKGGGFKDVSLF